MVWGPTLSTNLLINLVLAKVPIIRKTVKRTSGHDLVIASSSAVGVEVFLFDILLSQESGGGRVFGDGTGGGNVVGGDGVSEVQEAIGSFDVSDGVGFGLQGLEEGRVVNIS